MNEKREAKSCANCMHCIRFRRVRTDFDLFEDAVRCRKEHWSGSRGVRYVFFVNHEDQYREIAASCKDYEGDE